MNQNNDNWATPDYIYKPLNDEFDFDFDPCPLNEGPILPENDGLLIDWGQRNFINPPYSKKLKTAFVERAVHFKNQGRLCVCLIPNIRETDLFWDIIKPNATELRDIRKRIRFMGKNTKGEYVKKGTGRTGSLLVVFDGREKALTEEVKVRSLSQNNPWHLFCEELAQMLNDSGKEHLWMPIQEAITQKGLTKNISSSELSLIAETLIRHLSEKFGVSLNWPSRFRQN